jgi:ABC-type hemin transport system substrate-binding protein
MFPDNFGKFRIVFSQAIRFAIYSLSLVLITLVPCKTFAGETRIVSLAPSTTEWMDALGLSQFVVGVTEQCDTPPSMAKLPKVGSFMRTSVEQVLLRKPTDVVAVEGLPATLIRQLESRKIRVHIFRVSRISDFSAQIMSLGHAFGAQEKAQIWAERFNKIARSLIDLSAGAASKTVILRPPPTSVLLVVSVSPLFVATPKSWLSELFESTGYRNALRNVSASASENADFVRVSTESALAAGVNEWVIFNDGGALENKLQEDKLARIVRTAQQSLKPRIRVFPADMFTRPGPRLLEAWALLNEGKP